MMFRTKTKTKISKLILVMSMLFAASVCQAGVNVVNAGWGGGPVHYHGGGYGPGPYYGGGGGIYFGGGWGGPNLVINVPAAPPRYYVRNCENMEVCDEYGQCWLERYCD